MKKCLLLCLCTFLFILTGCGEKNNSSDIYIAEIAPDEVVCIASIEINSDSSYLLNISTKSGITIFAALNENDDVISMESVSWQQYKSKDENPFSVSIPFSDNLPEGVYYLYIGSTGKKLTGVNISVIASGSTAAIELLR